MKMNIRSITTGAVVAALYVVLSAVFAPISFGQGSLFGLPGVQFRVAEILTVLPALTSSAVPGLAIGCLLSNLLIGNLGPIDIVLGTSATLIAAIGARALRKHPSLVPLAPIIVNALIVGSYLPFLLDIDMAIPLSIAVVATGETVVVYLLGLPMLYTLRRISQKTDLFGE